MEAVVIWIVLDYHLILWVREIFSDSMIIKIKMETRSFKCNMIDLGQYNFNKKVSV